MALQGREVVIVARPHSGRPCPDGRGYRRTGTAAHGARRDIGGRPISQRCRGRIRRSGRTRHLYTELPGTRAQAGVDGRLRLRREGARLLRIRPATGDRG